MIVDVGKCLPTHVGAKIYINSGVIYISKAGGAEVHIVFDCIVTRLPANKVNVRCR